MGGIGYIDTIACLRVGHLELVEELLSGRPQGELIHEVATDPETAAQIVVALYNDYLKPGPGQVAGGHQPGGAGTDDDNVAFDVFFELFEEA